MAKIDQSNAKFKLPKIILMSLLSFIVLLIIIALITAITSTPEEKAARDERIKIREQKEKSEEKTKIQKKLKQEEEEEEPIRNYNKFDALIQSRTYIKDKLLSPGSADFSDETDGVKQINDTIFSVNSYVDSQNGFGAMLRTHYELKIIFHPKQDTHDIIDVKIR